MDSVEGFKALRQVERLLIAAGQEIYYAMKDNEADNKTGVVKHLECALAFLGVTKPEDVGLSSLLLRIK